MQKALDEDLDTHYALARRQKWLVVVIGGAAGLSA